MTESHSEKLRLRWQIRPLCGGLLCIALAPATAVAADAQEPRERSYDLVWGGVSNIEAGAALTIGATSLVFDEASLHLRASRFDHWSTRVVNVLVLQAYLGVTIYGSFAHEFFGHFGHGVEAGVAPSMTLNFPSFGGGTRFDTTYRTPALDRQIIASAGPEVTAVIASQTTAGMYSGHEVGSYVAFYLVGGNLIDGYVKNVSSLQPFLSDPAHYFATANGPPGPVPDDEIAWALALTERYGHYDRLVPAGATWTYVPPNPRSYLNDFIVDQGHRVTRAYVLQLFDPTILNGLYGVGRYVVTGEPFFRPYMIGTSKLKFAPSIHSNLGYLGAETYFMLYGAGTWVPPFDVYYRTGGNLRDEQQGAGVEVREIHVADGVDLRAQIDGWYDGLAKSFGGGVEESLTWRASSTVGVTHALGYKSAGGLLGKPTREGAYGYVGLRLYLPGPAR